MCYYGLNLLNTETIVRYMWFRIPSLVALLQRLGHSKLQDPRGILCRVGLSVSVSNYFAVPLPLQKTLSTHQEQGHSDCNDSAVPVSSHVWLSANELLGESLRSNHYTICVYCICVCDLLCVAYVYSSIMCVLHDKCMCQCAMLSWDIYMYGIWIYAAIKITITLYWQLDYCWLVVITNYLSLYCSKLTEQNYILSVVAE